MLLASAITLVLLRQGEPAPVVESFKWLGRTVEVRLPVGLGEISPGTPTVDFKGFRYALTTDGQVLGRTFENGGWAAVQKLYGAAKAKWNAETPTYHVAVFLVPRTDIVERTASGLHRRRNVIRGRELDADLLQVGMFVVAANAAAAGEFKVVADVNLDDDPVLVTADAANKRPFGALWAQDLVASRTNDGAYEADDKEFRGPYASSFVLHSGLQGYDGERFGTQVNSGSVLSMVGPASLGSADGLGRLMLSMLAKDFAILSSGAPTNESEAASMPLNRAVEACSGWTPWVRKRLAAEPFLESADGLTVSAGGGMPVFIPSANGFDFAAWGPYWKSSKEPGTVAVPATLAELVRTKWPATTVKGVLSIDGVPALVMAMGPEGASTRFEASSPPSQSDAAGPEPMELTSANYAVQRSTDPEAGPVASIAESGSVRNGFAAIKGLLPANASGRYLEFRVRSRSRDSIAISMLGVDKGPYVVGPAKDTSIGDRTESKAVALQVPNDGNWQTVRVDLGESVTSTGAVLVRPPAAAVWWERVEFEPIRYDLAGFKLSDQLSGPPTPLGTLQTDEDMRLAKVQTANAAGLEKMLTDRSDLVIMNVLARLADMKVPATAEPSLVKMANSIDPKVSEYAIRCLVKLGSETSKPFVRGLILKGLFPHVRAFAAQISSLSKDPLLVGPISTLFASRNWHARISALESLVRLPGPEQPVVVTTFLNIAEPEVRVRAVQLADVRNETVCRRLLWTSVNDVSDRVRALACVRLLESKDAKYRLEGYKGAKDDSPWVRASVLEAIRLRGGSLDEPKPFVKAATSDAAASVRARALLALAALSGTVELVDTGACATDNSTEVRLAFIALAEAKRLNLPGSVLDGLRNSPNARVREAAKRLSG